MTGSWITDLSDGELRARLTQRGYDPVAADAVVADRDNPDTIRILEQELS